MKGELFWDCDCPPPDNVWKWRTRLKEPRLAQYVELYKKAQELKYGGCIVVASEQHARTFKYFLESFCGANSSCRKKFKLNGKYYWRIWRV